MPDGFGSTQLKRNDIRTASDGLEAADVAETFHPELVLLEIGLPQLNGEDISCGSWCNWA